MTLTFAETYNMVAYFTKSDASEGFNQIFDFLNRSLIKYALTVNPNIYVSCIKQFWTTVAVKKVNDVIRLQALVDKKKVEVEEGDVDENVENVNAGDAAEGDVSAAHDEVHIVQPPSPQPQPQPQPIQDAGIPINLLQEVMDTYTALTRRVEHLELDKVTQAMEITKLKQKVKKLERRNKERMIAEMYQDVDVVLEDDKEVADDVKDVQSDIDESAQDQGRKAESQAEIYKIGLEHANKVLSMQEDESEPAEVQEVVDVVTTVNIITEVVTAASETITAASTTITAAEAEVLEKIKEEESRALKRLNETPAEKAKKRYTCSNLKESKKCTWSSKNQGLEAVGIIWCENHYMYNNTTNFVSREEVPTYMVYSGSDAKCCKLMLPSQVKTADIKCCCWNKIEEMAKYLMLLE
uniref:Xylulose kinase-1 n=1 Tax=Tanacetum cinerariifolium TaxID=118510 RepID=A0A699HN55_TANCI|nr:hypothetical protein [Tanacetum cinerariifolium]